MKIMKRINIIILIFIISVTLTDCSMEAISTISLREEPTKVAVFLFDFSDDFISQIRQSLEDVQNENKGKVEYTFYDANANQTIQTESINKVLNEGVDLILNIVDRTEAKTVINRIKENNIPVILFQREPITLVPIQ